MWRLIFSLLLAFAAWGQTTHPILAVGSPAPDFSLPGVDGKIHRLADYAASPVLVVVFTCNHCPIAQMYEQRIQQLETDYGHRGVAIVAIQPNDPKAIRIDELDSSDISDSLEEMKIRVEYKHLHYPYLYDGETQSVTRAYGPQATPHVFVFDKDRKLRYEGRMDNSYRKEMVNTQDARNAISALLANRVVPVKKNMPPAETCCSLRMIRPRFRRHLIQPGSRRSPTLFSSMQTAKFSTRVLAPWTCLNCGVRFWRIFLPTTSASTNTGKRVLRESNQ